MDVFYNNELISIKEKSEYKYYIQIFVEKIIGLGIILLAAIYDHLLLQTIFFLLFFSSIRKYSGGFHAKSFIQCMNLSISIYFVYTKFLFPYFVHNKWLNISFLVVALIIILFIGAVNHPNMNWNREEYIICANTARMICLIEVSVIIALSSLEIAASYILFMSFGVILSAVMLLIAKIIRQEVIL